jgi:hypothetical protein
MSTRRIATHSGRLCASAAGSVLIERSIPNQSSIAPNMMMSSRRTSDCSGALVGGLGVISVGLQKHQQLIYEFRILLVKCARLRQHSKPIQHNDFRIKTTSNDLAALQL